MGYRRMVLSTEHSQPIGERNSRYARRRRTACTADHWVWLVACSLVALYPSQNWAVEIVRPAADGTLVDGGVFGDLDGVVDRSSWEFDSTGMSGAVTLATAIPASAVEQRVVCEYDLRTVKISGPVVAVLSFTVRSASVFPSQDVRLQIYSYSADLMESPGDFSAEPIALLGTVVVPSVQEPTSVDLDVSDAVSAALMGDRMMALRFQIASDDAPASNQVFIDAFDAEPKTKPTLIIGGGIAGDADNDGDVDVNDFAALTDCLTGPGVPPVPSGSSIDAIGCLWIFDRDGDGDVDLDDHSAFLEAFQIE